MLSPSRKTVKEAAEGLVDFINDSPSPYHTVSTSKVLLINAGFKQLNEKEKWKLEKGEKYFLTRNQSALVAFVVGKKYETGNGFTLVGAHTDSPCLKLKPVSKKEKYGYLQVGVQCYGGALWRTWFDRDLTVAGRVVIKNWMGYLEHHLVNLKKPILRVPNLCIHLSTTEDYSKEEHLLPILATRAFEDGLNKKVDGDEDVYEIPQSEECLQSEETTKKNEGESSEEGERSEEDKDTSGDESAKHHTILIKLICEKVGCKPKDLVNMELSLADTQPATLGGAYDEFIFAPRMDNQFGSYCAVTGIIQSAAEGVGNEKNVRMINIFDNEEVGSRSAQGAQSLLSELVMRRICEHFGGNFEQCIANSFLLSADQGHAIHPNYPEKHEDNHQPTLHKGPLLKINANQRYSTTAITAAVIRDIAKQVKVTLQDYVVRNDSHCGTTIGPIQAAQLGIRTVDVGGPELSMHSIRETAGITCVSQMITLFKGFYRLFPQVDADMKAD